MTEHDSDTNQKYQGIVKDIWEALNSGNLSVLKPILAASYTLNGKAFTYEETVAWLKSLEAEKDLYFDRQDLFGEGQKVCVRWFLTLTDKKTGDKIRGMGCNVITFDANNQAISNWQAGASTADEFTPVGDESSES